MGRLFLFFMLSAVLTGCGAGAVRPGQLPETASERALETNENIENAVSSEVSYRLKTEREEIIPWFSFNEAEGTFRFSYDVLSSYLAVGTYREKGDCLILQTEDGKYSYVFERSDEDTLIFNKEESSDTELTDERIGTALEDGAEFIKQ